MTALLMASVGPSSAASMLPRQGIWQFWDGLITRNVTEDSLYLINLQHFNSTITGDYAYEAIRVSDMLSLGTQMVEISNRINTASVPSPVQSGAWSKAVAGSSTISMELTFTNFLNNAVTTSTQASGVLGDLRSLRDFTNPPEIIHLDGVQDAYSRVECFFYNKRTWDGPGSSSVMLDFSSASQGVDILQNMTEDEYATLQEGSKDPCFWHYFVQELSDNSTGIVFATRSGILQADCAGTNHTGDAFNNTKLLGVDLLPCICELGWFPSKVRSSNGIAESQGPPQRDDPKIRRAYPDKAWLASINPLIPGVNKTVGSWMNQDLGLEFMIPFSALLTSALSETSLGADRFSWENLGISSSAYPTGSTFSHVKYSKTQSKLSYLRSGYGYAANNPSIQLALAILFAYGIIAIAHIAFSLYTGFCSSAWDSLPEVVALALTSRPPAELQNTCAGIQSIKVFEHRVRVAPTPGDDTSDHIELLFPSSGVTNSPIVQTNKLYGTV